MKEIYIVDKRETISEVIDNDTVIVNLQTGCYYSLNATASFIWDMLKEGSDNDSIANNYKTVFNIEYATASKDTANILSTLKNKSLINRTAEIADIETDFSFSIPYIEPVIEEFTDMQEMLLLDPIHEVSEDGWPYKKDV